MKIIDKEDFWVQTHNTRISLRYGSAVGIATAYRLDDQEAGVRVPLGSRIFTSSYRIGAHPASYLMGTGGFFPRWIERQEREADHSLQTSAEVKETWIYTSTPPYVFME
jgi:hypothetical protein